MMKIYRHLILATTILFACLSCVNPQHPKSPVKNTHTPVLTNVVEDNVAPHYRFTFLGHDFDCTRDDLYSEFVNMCSTDSKLSFDDKNGNLTICGVGFHVNLHETGSISLLSSVTAESRRIIPVRDMISRYHGKSNYEEPYHYTWGNVLSADQKTITWLRLRRVHSDEGGTVIFIDSMEL